MLQSELHNTIKP